MQLFKFQYKMKLKYAARKKIIDQAVIEYQVYNHPSLLLWKLEKHDNFNNYVSRLYSQ